MGAHAVLEHAATASFWSDSLAADDGRQSEGADRVHVPRHVLLWPALATALMSVQLQFPVWQVTRRFTVADQQCSQMPRPVYHAR